METSWRLIYSCLSFIIEVEAETLMIICAIMTSSESRKIGSFMILACGQRGQINKCGVISHALWVYIGILWALLFNLQVVSVANHREKLRMGGARKTIEPPNCVQLKKKQKLWGF